MKATTYSVGIDIGGTTVHYAVVDDAGKIRERGDLATRDYPEATDFLTALAGEIKRVVHFFGRDSFIGIGVGAPCVNPHTGAIEGATDLPWESPVPLAEVLGRLTGLSVYAANDANAAALGEMQFGAARGMRNFIMLTLGTGVGAGVVADGRLLEGSRGFAGELGHIYAVGAEDRMCSCGRPGCLQTVASAGGIVATAIRMLESPEGKDSSLADVSADQLTAKTIAQHAKRGDTLASSVYEFTGGVLGTAFASYAAWIDPEAIILFGGVANAFDLMERSMHEAYDRNVLFLYKDSVKLMRSGLPEADAAILGAASLPYQKH